MKKADLALKVGVVFLPNSRVERIARGRLWWHGRLAFRLNDWIDRRFLSEH